MLAEHFHNLAVTRQKLVIVSAFAASIVDPLLQRQRSVDWKEFHLARRFESCDARDSVWRHRARTRPEHAYPPLLPSPGAGNRTA